MADATQVQRRRGTQAQCEAMTPAEGEIIVDLTADTTRVGDGSRSGGFIQPNFNHVQQNTFTFAVATGTANAVVVALTPAPLSYGQGLSFKFRAADTNSGATTIAVNGQAPVAIQKLSGTSFVDLAAGDIVNGAIYQVISNGVTYQLLGGGSAGSASIGQGQMKTSTGIVSVPYPSYTHPYSLYKFTVGIGGMTMTSSFVSYISTLSVARRIDPPSSSELQFLGQSVALPGGQYGFTPEVRRDGSNIYAQQRYITSSPPYDLGDGEVGGFIYLLLQDGVPISHYAADTPPWAYNGPTCIRADHICPVTGKKFRKISRKRTFEEFMGNVPANIELEEITNAIKNADMDLIPHPFGELKPNQTVVLLDPMSARVQDLVKEQNQGNDIIVEMISGNYLNLTQRCKSCGPKGVEVVKFKVK